MDRSVEALIALIPLLPLAGAIVNGLVGHRLPRSLVSLVAVGTVVGSFVISWMVASELHSGGAGAELSQNLYTWMSVGGLSVDMRFVVDQLSAVMILVVTGVGALIHVYSTGYMAHDPAYARYFSYLNLFTFSMLVLVLGDSLPLTFVGWEGVGLCSYLLIGFWYTDLDKAIAGKKAFVVNRIGDFGFLVAMMLLFRSAGTVSYDGLASAASSGLISGVVATGVGLMLVLGATGKSAQIPLYVWLPDAMAGPTPVSALIHAATMVTAGVYLTARLAFLFALSPVAMLTIAGIGAATALFAATIGTAQNDIKKVLAYSTVSQLGFMFIAAGVGAYAIAVFHLITHAFFKACLFLGSGSVIHGMSGEQDMRRMGGLYKKMPVTFATFFVATLAITGFPFLSGFISKDAILWNAFAADEGAHAEVFATAAKIIWGMGVLAAGFTAFYMWRLVFLTFFSGELRAKPEVRAHVHESPFSMTMPLVVLAGLSLVAGALAWPHVLGGHEWLVEWLAPVVGASPAPEGEFALLEYSLMTVSTVVAGFGFVIAYALYAKGIHPLTQRISTERPWAFWNAAASAKWYVDELYEVAVIRPIGWVSRAVLYEVLDRRVIDGSVNFVGWLARTVGFFGQVLQSGNVQRYLAVFATALAILIYGWMLPEGGVSTPPPPAAAMPQPIDDANLSP
jgi:NADH-quinone oxidoreductase subunit L